MRILVLADLGQPAYHVGDEAMGIAAGHELAQRGFETVYATRDIEHSKAFIDGNASFIKTLSFPWPPSEREPYLEQVRAHLAGHPADQEIERFVSDLRTVDAVVIAGGGNMNSRYGWLLYERAAFALVARGLGIPLVITGQSFGPVLTDFDAGILREALNSAQVVSAREYGSHRWALQQGLDIHAGIDDASFYYMQERTLPHTVVDDLPEKYVCATFNALEPHDIEEVARVLDSAYEKFHIPTVFLPHMGNPGKNDGDVALHHQIAHRMASPATVLPMLHVDQAAKVHREAYVGFSTRYHPAVFSLAASVPFVGVLPDAFTDQRVRGAMAHFGAEDFALPLALLHTGTVGKALTSALEHRNALAAQLETRAHELQEFSNRFWDAIARTLNTGQGNIADLPELTTCATIAPQVKRSWMGEMAPVRDLLAQVSLTQHLREADLDRALTWDAVHRVARDEARARITQLEEELAHAHTAHSLTDSLKKSMRSRFKR